MTLEQLKKDKTQLEAQIAQANEQRQRYLVQGWRLEGALAYVNDNIKALEEKRNAQKEKDAKKKEREQAEGATPGGVSGRPSDRGATF